MPPKQTKRTCTSGCYRPKLDGTDTCLECAAWYRQTPAGKCELEYLWVICLIAALLGILLLALLAYLVELHWRPATNILGLDCGLAARSQQKYRDQNRELCRCLPIFVVPKWVDRASCSISTSWQSFPSRTGSLRITILYNGDTLLNDLLITSARQTSLFIFILFCFVI